MVNSFQAVSKTHQWIVEFVIGLNICPFAVKPKQDNLIAYRVYGGSEAEQALSYLALALEEIKKKSSNEIETIFLILPNMLESFDSFWDFMELAELLLIDQKLEGIIQLVPFHPDFRFEDSPVEDVANFTNRSPFPMLHLLREDSVHRAIQGHGNVEDIPMRNIKLLRSMNLEEVKSYSSK